MRNDEFMAVDFRGASEGSEKYLYEVRKEPGMGMWRIVGVWVPVTVGVSLVSGWFGPKARPDGKLI